MTNQEKLIAEIARLGSILGYIYEIAPNKFYGSVKAKFDTAVKEYAERYLNVKRDS